MKRIFIIVLDSFGIGALPDAAEYGDEGSNTLGALTASGLLHVPCLSSLGLFHIEGPNKKDGLMPPKGAYGRMAEFSKGKDTTTGHWEIAGLVSEEAFPTYPQGFPPEIISAFEAATGRKVLCNRPYSGTDVIRDFGREHLKTGDLIVYTSADSVFQIAAHEGLVPLEKLYEYCRLAREILTGENAVARVIARPFTGEYPDFVRTNNRHDFSLEPDTTMLDILSQNDLDVIAVGKIHDIFAGKGLTDSIAISGNEDGMNKTIELLDRDFKGLAFINLVDFDSLYGHRNDVKGYTEAMNSFDRQLTEFLSGMKGSDLLVVTADHGCDPSTPSTDHSREYVPLLAYGQMAYAGVNLGTRKSFADIAKTVLEIFDLPSTDISGESFKAQILESSSEAKAEDVT